MRKCPECKTNNPDSAKICNHCGKNLLEEEKKDSRPVVAPGYDFSGTRSVRAFHLNRKEESLYENPENINNKADVKNTESLKGTETRVLPEALFEDRYVIQRNEHEDKNSTMEVSSSEDNNVKKEKMQRGIGGFFQRMRSLL